MKKIKSFEEFEMNNYQGVTLNPSKVPTIVLRKINNLFNIISKDEAKPNEL